jgi:hypothetical protein
MVCGKQICNRKYFTAKTQRVYNLILLLKGFNCAGSGVKWKSLLGRIKNGVKIEIGLSSIINFFFASFATLR